MELIDISLIVATLLTALVAGFLFAFSVVVMPGIAALRDRDYLKAFKAIDRVIQNGNPVFVLIWIGSALAMIASASVSIWQLEGIDRILVFSAAIIYMLGVQLTTLTINVPLNNRLQAEDLENLPESDLSDLRKRFEIPWVRWNGIRTIFAAAASTILIIVCLRVEG
ncbi:MAG: anthrone oxygenase family protein [Pyrinomonadaceae bacterium]